MNFEKRHLLLEDLTDAYVYINAIRTGPKQERIKKDLLDIITKGRFITNQKDNMELVGRIDRLPYRIEHGTLAQLLNLQRSESRVITLTVTLGCYKLRLFRAHWRVEEEVIGLVWADDPNGERTDFTSFEFIKSWYCPRPNCRKYLFTKRLYCSKACCQWATRQRAKRRKEQAISTVVSHYAHK